MKKTAFRLLLISSAIALAVGCAPVPVQNVAATPIVTTKKDITLVDVNKAIQNAGTALGWQMTTETPGHVLGKLPLRTHLAVVDINYDLKSYSIKYKDSINLKYDGTNIHKNYNEWVKELDDRIRIELRLL